MIAELHRDKAERIEASLARLGDEDWEIRIEAAMLAGTHWINFALHQAGVSEASEDMVHASMCMVSVLRKYRLAAPELIEALEEIEELRPLYVRGDMDGAARAARRALELLGFIGERARRLA
ncbi:hypothetical protein AXYL_02376 [Achromobacter xylosoxidans A8]|uniref:Uncharacterized protein n=1 Tax=Achromobacter xylosoxidans (strain A8) TaxID=762376 RepID=E3HL24_ACHXA|nr:hypothetical protein [Achromobacter xylosoxidans]ADP15697.1 hypothetical protein AXYL_02376 [Achromobacter xylosoxidans A8]